MRNNIGQNYKGERITGNGQGEEEIPACREYPIRDMSIYGLI